MKLYISTEMLAVCFHCVKWNCLDAFSAFQRNTHSEREPLLQRPLLLSLVLPRFSPSSSSSGPDNFPQRAPFFYRLSTFSRPAFPRVPSSIISKRSRAGPGALVCELRRACFLRERTWCSIEQKYAWNSSFPSSASLHRATETKAFLFY